jgi:chromosome segregation ATPase
MTNIQDILKRYENQSFDDEVIEMIEALLHWAAETPENDGVISHSPTRRTNPFSSPLSSPPTPEPQYSKKTLIADSLKLTALAFRLEDKKLITNKLNELAEKVEEKAKQKLSAIRSQLDDLQSITNTIERHEEELVKLRETENERKIQIADKEQELTALRNRVKQQSEREQEIDREFDLLKKQMEDLDSKISQYETEKESIKNQIENLKKTEKELEELKKTYQEEEKKNNEYHSQIQQIKTNLKETKKLIETIQEDRLFDPAISQKIREIWQSLPADMFDKKF